MTPLCDGFLQVVNVILRLAWVQTVLDFHEASFLHRTALVAFLTSLEIIRRGIWNFFRLVFLVTEMYIFSWLGFVVDGEKCRLENEHLNNVGKYRAFKSVPLPFSYENKKD